MENIFENIAGIAGGVGVSFLLIVLPILWIICQCIDERRNLKQSKNWEIDRSINCSAYQKTTNMP